MEKKMLKRSMAVWMVLALLFTFAAPIALMEGEEAPAASTEEVVSNENIISEETSGLLDETEEMLDNVTVEGSEAEASNKETAEDPAADAASEDVTTSEKEAPVVEEPAVEETPVAEEPAAEETPTVEEPTSEEEAPVVEESVVEETPAVEEPAVEETPAVEEPAAEETPVVEEPAVEETPVVEEPAAAETPVVEAPVAAPVEIPEEAEKIMTLQDALNPERSIDIYAVYEGDVLRVDLPVTLIAELHGYDNLTYTLQWEVSYDGEIWQPVGDLNSFTYSFVLNETLYNAFWRVVVNITEAQVE